MNTEGFKITQLSFYNYGQKELKGSIMLQHSTSMNKMELTLNDADCSKIINIIADRVAETIHEAARQFWVDVGMPAKEFMPVAAQSSLTDEQRQKLIEDTDPAFGGEKED